MGRGRNEVQVTDLETVQRSGEPSPKVGLGQTGLSFMATRVDDLELFTEGRVIGYFRGRPIYDHVKICGIRYEYDGLAREGSSASNIRKLGSDEAYVEPGLLYRRSE